MIWWWCYQHTLTNTHTPAHTCTHTHTHVTHTNWQTCHHTHKHVCTHAHTNTPCFLENITEAVIMELVCLLLLSPVMHTCTHTHTHTRTPSLTHSLTQGVQKSSALDVKDVQLWLTSHCALNHEIMTNTYQWKENPICLYCAASVAATFLPHNTTMLFQLKHCSFLFRIIE